MSGISYLGSPGLTYQEGASPLLGFLAVNFIAAPISAYIIMPFYYNARITTVYEYLELRFCTSIRTTASVLFVVKTIVYLGMVLYAPSLVLSTLTQIPLFASIITTGSIAMLFTMKGGMLAVIWTDAMQSVAMVLVAFITLTYGISRSAGSPATTLHTAHVLHHPPTFGHSIVLD